MPNEYPSIINIALVCGGPACKESGGLFCKEVLEKTTFDYKRTDIQAGILVVVGPDPDSEGLKFANELGLTILTDYHELYDQKYNIHLIILLTPEEAVLEDILKTRPAHIRVLAYPVFRLFWKAIHLEEKKLRERTEEIETILNGIQDFILVITPERKIIEVNEAFLKQMGYTREEVLGRRCHEVFQNIDEVCTQGEIVCPLNETIRNKRPSQQVLTRVDHNGEKRYIEVTIFPIWEGEGKISKFIEVSRDITDKIQQQEKITRVLGGMVRERTRQLEETHAKLLHQDKMASLGKLSASVVHEINNPIAGILNLIMLIKRMISEEDVGQKEMAQFGQYLNLMETETRRISRIVSNLLAFSRQSKMEPRRLDLNQLIEKTLFLNSNLLKIHSVRVEKSLDPGLPELVGSEDQLQQVFMNFVSNAAEAIEAKGGGVLSIETKHSSKNGHISVSFKDTGVGIPEENLSKLFEPFFTTKKKGKGVGLGLSVAYGIIEEHGGSIQVDSEVGKGTTFEVTLPLEALAERQSRNGGVHDKNQDPHS
jgi:two-component system NtrC family sensor kinase